MDNKKIKIAHLLSGGVDSSVALYLLKEKGFDVTAYYIKIWLEDDLAFLGDCPWEEDLKYAKAVCDQLEVPLKTISLQQEYFETVVEYTISELKAGRTPSPDILCNQKIKFDLFLKRIQEQFDYVSSGHYAQIELKNGMYYLKESPDSIKDQTYFLTYLSQVQLSRIFFPIGNLTKRAVRSIADKANLPNKDRKDSQGICFLGKIRYNDFIKFHLGEKKGDIINLETGKILGKHKGYWYHTIGQRQGLGLSGGPWYVVKKNIEENIIYVTNKIQSDLFSRNKFVAQDINWIPELPAKRKLKVKIRHGKKKYNCQIENINFNKAIVSIDEKEKGISPGQFSIFYDSSYCLGGGVIDLYDE